MAKININAYKMNNNIIVSNKMPRYIIGIFGDETELVYDGTINAGSFKDNTNLRKIYIRNCPKINASHWFQSPFLGCSPNLQIFIEARTKPADWGYCWNVYKVTKTMNGDVPVYTLTSYDEANIHWGATRAAYEEYCYD